MGVVRKGRKEGGREEQGSQQAWRRGREKRKQNKKTQTDGETRVSGSHRSRPPRNKAGNSEAEGPGAQSVPVAAWTRGQQDGEALSAGGS